MDQEQRYWLKKGPRKEKKAEADNKEGYIQELRVPTTSRREIHSGDEGYYRESTASPRHFHTLHKYETRSPEEYKSRASSGPRVTRKILEPISGSSRREYDHGYLQSMPRHSSWVEFEEGEFQEELIRDTDRNTRRNARHEAEKEDYTKGPSKTHKYSRDIKSDDEYRLEFDVKPRSHSRRKTSKRAHTMPEAGAETVASVQRASVNLRRLGAEDPREYMELKYGVLVEPNEKSVEDIEREADFEKAIKRSTTRPSRTSSSYYDEKRMESKIRLQEMEMDMGKKMKMKMEPEIQTQLLFSDPSDLSSSNSNSSDDEQIQAIIRAASYSDNVTIPDTHYEPQTEVFRQEKEKEKRTYSAKTAAVADDRAAEEAARLRAQNLRDLERSIREREAFVASQEESLLRRQKALEERERRAAAQEREMEVRLRDRTERDRDREREPSRRRDQRPRVEEYGDDTSILDYEPPSGSGSNRLRFSRGEGEDPWYEP